jgi:hypothetical protein
LKEKEKKERKKREGKLEERKKKRKEIERKREEREGKVPRRSCWKLKVSPQRQKGIQEVSFPQVQYHWLQVLERSHLPAL